MLWSEKNTRHYLLEEQEEPPAVIVDVNKGGGVDEEHDPGLQPLVVVPARRQHKDKKDLENYPLHVLSLSV